MILFSNVHLDITSTVFKAFSVCGTPECIFQKCEHIYLKKKKKESPDWVITGKQRKGNRPVFTQMFTQMIIMSLAQPKCKNDGNCENNIKSVLLQSWEERNSLHNTQRGSAAVALITQPIQLQPRVLTALIRHTASHTCAGGGRWMHPSPELNILPSPRRPFLHPPAPPPWNSIVGSAAPHRTGSVCSGAVEERVRWGGGCLDKRCIYSSWFRMPADRQWTHSAVPKTNSCVQPLPVRGNRGQQRWETKVSVVGMKGKFPKVDAGVVQKMAENNSVGGSPEGEVHLQHGGLAFRCVSILSHTWKTNQRSSSSLWPFTSHLRAVFSPWCC